MTDLNKMLKDPKIVALADRKKELENLISDYIEDDLSYRDCVLLDWYIADQIDVEQAEEVSMTHYNIVQPSVGDVVITIADEEQGSMAWQEILEYEGEEGETVAKAVKEFAGL